MPKSTLALGTPLRAQLGRLAALEPYDAPFLSLYLDLHVDHEGRHTYDTFLRKAFGERQRTLTGAARKSFESDIERIDGYLNAHVRRSADGLAIFACAARDEFFEAVQLDVPHEHNWLFIASVPYLYPLARVNEQFPRYAALVVDTNAARLFVFALGAAEARREVNNVKTRKASGGGWAQARYERHLELFHLHHVKEVVDLLDRVVREEAIGRIVIACDATARPLLTDQLPQHLAERVVEMMRLDIHTPAHRVLARTLEALRAHDAREDAERAGAMLDAWRAGGLAVAGPDDTLDALARRQVEELLVTTRPALLRKPSAMPPDAAPGPVDVETDAPGAAADPDRLKLADELVRRAQQSGSRIRFVEDPALLAEAGGVGALLRFRV